LLTGHFWHGTKSFTISQASPAAFTAYGDMPSIVVGHALSSEITNSLPMISRTPVFRLNELTETSELTVTSPSMAGSEKTCGQ
jgi:hypothetical protein